MNNLKITQTTTGKELPFGDCIDRELREARATLCFNGFYVSEGASTRDGYDICMFIGTELTPDDHDVIAAAEALLTDLNVTRISYARCAPKCVHPALDPLAGRQSYKGGVNEWQVHLATEMPEIA